MGKPQVILVNIEQHREWHIATSKDLDGLFAFHPDLPTLIKEIPEVIKALYKEKEGVVVDVCVATSPDNHDTYPLRYIATANLKAA